MKKRTILTKTLALALSFCLLPCQMELVSATETEPHTATQENTLPEPAYLWNFDSASIDGDTVHSLGTVASGNAVLHGASTTQAAVSIGNNTYSAENNSVLTLSGGSKGTSYVDLPGDLYNGVSAETGLTWSFWMKPDTNVVSYSRLFSSTNTGKGMEFAYAPYAADNVWNLIFDDSNGYKQIHAAEPQKGVWSYVTITISREKVIFYINGDEAASTCGEGNASNLASRLNGLVSFPNHSLGKTNSTWSDADCKAQLDDVAVYKSVLSAEQVADLARTYGLQPKGPRGTQDASEGTYGTDGQILTQLEKLTTTSADGRNTVKLWTDTNGRYYYSVSRDGKVVIECSAIGITTKESDLSLGLVLDDSSIVSKSGVEDYDILQGSTSHVKKKYNETAFTLHKDKSRVTVYFRVFDDGMAYRYEVDGDTESTSEITTVTGESSEFVLPDKGTIWTVPPSATYEGFEYSKSTVNAQYEANTKYSTPILASLGADSGNAWVLLSEANVYNEVNPYCASIFKTETGKKNMQVTFGQYLKQETDESLDGKKYSASYAYISEVNMENIFHTPWRVAIIASDLEGISNSSLVTDLNPEPEGDFSWVEPGGSVWSWWSTSEDAIAYSAMHDYIDFAAETGLKYCLVDFGWENWDNYRQKMEDLVAYADTKNIGLLLWYGVNKFDQPHIFDLDNEEEIEKEFAWCEEIGIKGVKVDYINSDSQFAMNIMYLLADIAAEHHLVLNYHGCTNPNGENRTYPNILSSEAVAGMEYFKWNMGSSVPTLLTLPYTRNVLGSMEFTPVAYRVSSSNATAGFMLATTIAYESAVQTFAHSAYVYPGYKGLSLLADLPTTWDESRLVDGYPGEYIIRARRNGGNWYLGAMTLDARTCEIPLNFLEAGSTYHAYIYSDSAAGDTIEIATQEVTSKTTLKLPLLANGGCSVKFTKTDPLKSTIYDNYNYYEAEDNTFATCSGAAKIADNNYASNLKCVGYIGGAAANTLTFAIPATASGEYNLKVFFISGSARNLFIRVNDEEPIVCNDLVGKPNDWAAVGATKDIPINLNKGVNHICLYNDSADAPNIDRIAISKLDISAADVTLGADTYPYTGNACIPAVTVRYQGMTLVKDQDFTVTCRNNINAGNAQVIISGIGNCSGTITKTFTITPKNISAASLTLTPGSVSYNGKAQKPKTVVTLGGKALVSGKDYAVSYRNNTNIGTATVTVTGKGNYTGSKNKSFPIKVKKGSQFAVNGYKYKITTASEAAFTGLKSNKSKKIKIPKTVTIGGKKFKVTSIANKALRKNTKVTSISIGANVKTIGNSAFEGCKNLTKVTVEKNVTKIGSSAFKNCKKLGSITIKSTKLKSVGKNSCKGIKPTAKIKVPSKKLKSYKKLFKNKGQGTKVKITK